MKKTRKILSILLALIMALSLCTVAFAEGDEPAAPEIVYNWVRIPTSAEGLEKGAYYLDFNDLYDVFYNEDALGIDEDTPAAEAAALKAAMKAYAEAKIAEFAAGEWYFDEAKCAFKAILPLELIQDYYEERPQVEGVDAGDSEGDEDTTVEVGSSTCLMIFSMAFEVGKALLHQVGENFVPVKLSTEGLQDGDYYLDAEAAIAKAVAMYREYLAGIYEEGKPVREDFESDAEYEEALAEYDEMFATEYDIGTDEELAAEMREGFVDTLLGLLYNTEDSSLLKVIVNAMGTETVEGGEEKEVETTQVLPFFMKFMISYYVDMGWVATYEEAAEYMFEGDIMTAAVLAGIKQYKEEKPEEPTPDKPSDKDEDGGYSNNAFMKFIKKIIQWFKDLFSKIFK